MGIGTLFEFSYWMNWYEENVYNSVIVGWIFFFLYPIQMGMIGYKLFNLGLYHISTLGVITFLLHITGIDFIDRKAMYITFSISPMANLFNNLLLDRKKYNRACYLALTKKSMLCMSSQSGTERIPAVKHWAVICESSGKGYYVFDARGRIIQDLQPKFEVMSKETVEKLFFGFYPLGFTNKNLIRRFVRLKFKHTVTCQQYVHFSCNFLLRPPSTSCQLTKFYGRFSYVCVIGLILLMFFFNLVFGKELNLDLNLPIVIYYMFDFTTETDSDKRDPIRWKEFASILISAFLLVTLRSTGWWDFNGSILASHVLFTFLLFVYLKIVMNPFPDISEKKKTM